MNKNLLDISFDYRTIRPLRAASGLTLSRAADSLGITRQRLFAYETGQDRIPADILLRMTVLYKCDANDFISQKIF